jgi:A118 family predicted phage portal protein
MLDRKNIADVFGIEIQDNADIPLWAAYYDGTPPYLGTDGISDTINLGYSVAHELARLVTLEFKSELSSPSENGQGVFSWAKIVDDSPKYTEYACALGGVMLKPYYDGSRIITNYVRADSFFPTAFDSNNDITGCIFIDSLKKGRIYFTRLEYHRYSGSSYLISNRAFMSENDTQLGREISLVTVPEWAEITAEAELENVKTPLYAYLGMTDGRSAYSRALDIFRNADEQYSRLLWEAKATEPAVFADVTVLRPDNDKKRSKLSRLSNRLFKLLDLGDDDLIREYAPQIRDASQINILNTILRRAEFLCGLAYGTLSDINDTEKTASEIKTSMQRSYATVKAIQQELQNALERYLGVVSELFSIYELGAFESGASFDFDDSLVNDTETEQKILMQEVSAGLISPVFYLQRRYGVTEEQALEMLPKAVE